MSALSQKAVDQSTDENHPEGFTTHRDSTSTTPTPAISEPGAAERPMAEEQPAKRGRGRPKKHPIPTIDGAKSVSEAIEPVASSVGDGQQLSLPAEKGQPIKRRPGRPKKNPEVNTAGDTTLLKSRGGPAKGEAPSSGPVANGGIQERDRLVEDSVETMLLADQPASLDDDYKQMYSEAGELIKDDVLLTDLAQDVIEEAAQAQPDEDMTRGRPKGNGKRKSNDEEESKNEVEDGPSPAKKKRGRPAKNRRNAS
jgi:hypothetical protein